MPPIETEPVGALQTGFDIVEALKTLDGGGVTEIAQHLDIPKSTAHSHLSTLQRLGYVKRNGESYELSLRFLELGGYTRDRMELYRAGRDHLRELSEQTNDWANLLTEEGGRGVYVAFARGSRAVEMDLHLGKFEHLHATALGKSILAHKPREEVDHIVDTYGLPEMTNQTVTARESLYEELDVVRERGYAYDYEERLQGLRCVGAPIIVGDERVIGAISISAPATRMKGERLEDEIPEMVTNAANIIGINMTYS